MFIHRFIGIVIFRGLCYSLTPSPQKITKLKVYHFIFGTYLKNILHTTCPIAISELKIYIQKLIVPIPREIIQELRTILVFDLF